MKTEKQWMDNLDHFESALWKGYDMGAFIRAIQSDAARSERERCAKCAEGEPSDSPIVQQIGKLIARDIRRLPDVGAEGERPA